MIFNRQTNTLKRKEPYHNFVGSHSSDHDYDAFAGLGDNLADFDTHSADMDYLN